MGELSPAMRAAMSRREASPAGQPRSLTFRGNTYRAHEPGHWLSADATTGLVYLHTRHVDVILNGVEFPRYDHDGTGRVTLTGNWKPITLSLERARSRFEPIDAWHARNSNYPMEQAKADKCMASLLSAIDAAETWLTQQGGAEQ